MASSDMGGVGPGYELCLKPHYAWLQNFFRIVPFARGYIGKEKLREVDVRIREYVRGRLDEAAKLVDEARQALASQMSRVFFSSAPMLSMPSLQPSMIGGFGGAAASAAQLQVLAEQLRAVYAEVSNTASDIGFADSGWAPVSAAQAIREEEILQLCDYDDTLIGLGEAALREARRLRDAAVAGDFAGVQSALESLREVLASIRAVYDERRRFLYFATARGGLAEAVAGVARSAAGAVGSALSRAKSLLSRIFGRGREGEPGP